MLIFAIKKLIRNGWLTICLCGGLIAAVALVTSVPMYTEGALQRVLFQDLKGYRENKNKYPGGIHISKNLNSAQDSLEAFRQLPAYSAEIEANLIKSVNLPLEISTSRLDLKSMFISDPRFTDEKFRLRTAKISAVPEIESHIVLIAGRLPVETPEGEYTEVMIHEAAMEEMDFLLGYEYGMLDMQLKVIGKLLVTGIFRIDTTSRGFWHVNSANLDSTFFVPSDSIIGIFDKYASNWSVDASWYYGFDTSRITTSECETLQKTLGNQIRYLETFGASADIPLIGIISDYIEKRDNLTTLLIFLIAPVFVIAAYFLFMLVELIMESEANDIALLKSRGSPSGQIIGLYFIMFAIPGFLAFLTGPLAGWIIAKVLGAADGFLEFGNTEGFSIPLSLRMWLFAAAAVAICFTTILMPIIRSSRTTIVLHKAKSARSERSWIWKGLIPAIILVLIALYALYSYQIRQQILIITSAQGVDLPLDPLYFIAASLFIFGGGMIILRVLPLSLSLIFRLTRKILPVVMYTSLIRVGRSFNRERYAFMFLLLTVASGIFYSSAARSLNLSTEQRIYYANGSDVRLVPISRTVGRNTPTPAPVSRGDDMGMDSGAASMNSNLVKFLNERNELIDIFPELVGVRPKGRSGSKGIDEYELVSGVDSAELVAKIPEAVLIAPNGRRVKIDIIGVDPTTFGKTAWYRQDLNTYTFQSYLEALARNPDHVFVSAEILDQYQYDLRKPFSVQIKGSASFSVYVVDAVELWPSVNPQNFQDDDGGFLVCNLDYLNAMISLQQVEVWLQRTDRVDDVAFYTSLLENGFDFVELDDSRISIRQEVIAPQFAGFNGALTLSFIATVAVSLMGFVVCWVVSLHERQLQFGVFRSLGMTSRSVVGILVWEQLFISGSAIIAGSAIGSLVSQLFLPILGLTASASEQVPPLQIGAYKSDYYAIIAIVGVMLIFAFVFLGMFVSRMKVHQALKLGEE